MLLYRILCAGFVAWAANLVIGRPEAASVVETFPEVATIVPLAGALVGFQNLAPRQGWGLLVAIANGIWGGVLVIGWSFLAIVTLAAAFSPQLMRGDVNGAGRVMSDTTIELADLLANVPLIGLFLTAAGVASIVTEGVHWLLVHMRRLRGVQEREERRAHRPSMY